MKFPRTPGEYLWPRTRLPVLTRFQEQKLYFRTDTGFTLIELAIGLAITLILAGLALGTHSAFSNYRTVSEINGLLTDLYYSRSEAFKRQSTITICRSDDGTSCSKGANWNNGWIIFADHNRNRVIDVEDTLLQIREGLRGPGSLTLGSGFYYYIMFAPSGVAYPRNTFKYCESGYPPRAIILFASGRARISSLNSSGKPLTC